MGWKSLEVDDYKDARADAADHIHSQSLQLQFLPSDSEPTKTTHRFTSALSFNFIHTAFHCLVD